MYDLNLPDRSSAAFIEALRVLEMSWQTQLPPDSQIAIYVLLPNRKELRLSVMSEQGFNGVLIEGFDENGEQCVLIAHQATLQFFCRVEKVTPGQPKRQIGFGAHPLPPSETQPATP
jgi:hypothetical protein